MFKRFVDLVLPPIVPKGLRKFGLLPSNKIQRFPLDENGKQHLDMYFDEEYSKILEIWGEGSTWTEIKMFLSSQSGKVLDIACGTGTVIHFLKEFKSLDVYGCDISDLLIEKAKLKGIPNEKLFVMDATEMSFKDDEFNFSYSIGSLEHFTERGGEDFIAEASRVSKIASFHMIPTSKSHTNEGWMTTSTTIQAFYNNSDDWWKERFLKSFREVHIINSIWNDEISFGRWFVCLK